MSRGMFWLCVLGLALVAYVYHDQNQSKDTAPKPVATTAPAVVTNQSSGASNGPQVVVVTATPVPAQTTSAQAGGGSVGGATACQYMTRLQDLTGGATTFPSGWIIANVWKDNQPEKKVLIGPSDRHAVSGWKGSAWSLPPGCDASAQQNFSGNPLPPMSVNEL